MPDLLLVDASPYIFRAYFSLPSSMTDSDGNPANAVYGFTGFLQQLLSQSKAGHIAVAFDRSLTTSFRNELYPAYKQQRELPPAELEAQMQACYDVSEALGFACFADNRYEADDLLGAIAHQLRNDGFRMLVVSSDKDLTQLLQGDDVFWDFARDKKLGLDGVEEQFGVRPDQIVDFLALMGDAVDNIPGVAGIGKKTAALLLQQFDSLDGLYERLDEVPDSKIRGAKSVAEKLAAQKDVAFMSRELSQIAIDMPLDLKSGAEALLWQNPDIDALKALFDRLKFGASLRTRLNQTLIERGKLQQPAL